VLVDEEIIVLGFQMRDAAVAVFEHLLAHALIDEVNRANAITGKHEDREDDKPSRRPDTFFFAKSTRSSANKNRPQPATPSQSVMSRVPIVGIRKNVVPSVPAIEPPVDTP
jgi:hypothetical protein